MTATLIAAVIIGQLGITVTGPLKPFFFLMFLFAIGYAVGPQFVRGIATDGLPQALFAVVVCVFCLLSAYLAAMLAGYDIGSAAGLYAGSQTISASMGLATDAINRLGLPPEEAEEPARRDAGGLCRHLHLRHDRLRHRSSHCSDPPCSASILRPHASATRKSTAARRRRAAPARLGIGLSCAPTASAKAHGSSARRRRKPRRCCPSIGSSSSASAAVARSWMRPSDTVIQAGDVVAIAGRRDVLVDLIGTAAEEVDDRELLAVPAEGLDVYVTSKEVDGKTLAELAQTPWARGVFLRKITRGATAIDIPILPHTKVNRGDIAHPRRTHSGRAAATKALGYAGPCDRRRRRHVHRRCDRDRRAAWRDRLQRRRRAADAVHVRRRPDRGPLLRLAALGPARPSAESRRRPSGS